MAGFKFRGINPAQLKPAPIPSPRVLPKGREAERLVTQHVRLNEAAENVVEAVVNAPEPPVTRDRPKFTFGKKSPATEERQHKDQKPKVESLDEHLKETQAEKAESKKLSRLVEHDFPFDPSQRGAIEGLAIQQYGCLTGAAGTGKTTVTKGLVDKLLDADGLGEVDMTTYFKKGVPVDEDDPDYEITSSFVPSVCISAFTGQASQMVKKNFPRDWHGNIMTIHRMLAFVPEFYEDWSPEQNKLVNKMRFVPTYGKWLKMPWDIVIIDEAGMVSIDLWNQVWDALKPGARVIFIGDINQLPPVHGRSIFGFGMTAWPTWELNTIHRQVGVNNSIVDNAWSILQGKTPKSDAPRELGLSLLDKDSTVKALNYMVTQNDWKSLLLQVPDDPAACSRRIRQTLKLLQDKFYDPIRDVVITAINGHDGSNGRVLGQIPLNMELAISLNQTGQRYIIDAGRERKNFGVGEKVMNTKNDHEAGVTNGMTGIITNIERNAAYAGDTDRFGTVEEVAAYLADVNEDDDEEFTLDDISESMAAQAAGKEAAKEKRDRGPASHIVTVRFGHGDHAFELYFASLSEVASLQTAYVVTCHKMQGSESPHIFTICHHVHKQMLFREWLYTAWTRASQKAVLLYSPVGLRQALNKQRIKGATLADKVAAFQALQKDYGVGAAVKVRLPEARRVS